jgi:hypothetical protein
MGQATASHASSVRIPYLVQNRGLDFFLGSIRRKASLGPCRILMGGTSIATFEPSINQIFSRHLKDKWGDASDYVELLGSAGGSFEALYQGWSKQPYGGPLYRRLRGDNTSSALSFQRYCSRFAVEYSTEVGGGSCTVQIDGVTVATLDCSGAQSYSNVATFNVPLGVHTLVINPPASGFVYLERIITTKGRAGIELIDGCLGGSALLNTQTMIGAAAPAVAGIAISGNVGLAAYFARTDVDLVIWSGPVNDCGNNGSTSTFATELNTAVAMTAAAGSKLLLICEMGGHFHDPADGNHSKFVTNSALMRQVAVDNAHVYALDWHALTAIADIAVYQATWYSGDFIHPVTAAYPSGINALCAANRLANPSLYTLTELNLYLRQKPSVPTGSTVTFTYGGSPVSLPAQSIGAQAFTGLTYLDTTPLVLSASITNFAAAVNAQIAAGSGSVGTFGEDEFGKYVEVSDQNLACLSGLTAGETVTFAMKVRTGTAPYIQWKPVSGDSFWFAGVQVNPGGLINSTSALRTTTPIWLTTDVKYTGANGPNMTLAGRIYQISVTRTGGQPVAASL